MLKRIKKYFEKRSVDFKIMFAEKVNKLSNDLIKALKEQIGLLRLYGNDYKGTYKYGLQEFNISYIKMKRELFKLFI